MIRAACICAALLVPLLRAADAGSPVAAGLIIPPAPTYVVGDAIPLIWQFVNRTDEPLAFMWEGCCRLNGRLEVTAKDQPIAPLPTGQALAHMFAKAERLEPGKPADFGTLLSDWVTLRDTGIYRLAGRYTGVLPTQQPQVPRGLRLWREAAETPPIEVALLSTVDYLAQRPERERQRGLTLRLQGPRWLQPLQSHTFWLAISNLTPQAQTVVWPGDLQLWLLDASGVRVSSLPPTPQGAYAEVRLQPRGATRLEIPFPLEHFEGEPFGEYRIFADLAEGPTDRPRVPSSVLPLSWQLGTNGLVGFIEQAASGSRVGLRNAPLKFLRLHLLELRQELGQLRSQAVSVRAQSLLKQLQLASCLKPFGPKPGRVSLPLEVGADSRARWAEPVLASCLQSYAADWLGQLKAAVEVRRHLGWEPDLQLLPARDTPTDAIFEAVRRAEPLTSELAGAASFVETNTANDKITRVTFPRSASASADVLRLRIAAAGPTLDGRRAVASPPGKQPEFTDLSTATTLAAWLDQPGTTTSALCVEADPGLLWGDLRRLLEPLFARGRAFDLVASAH
jgi:hypothetical protein